MTYSDFTNTYWDFTTTLPLDIGQQLIWLPKVAQQFILDVTKVLHGHIERNFLPHDHQIEWQCEPAKLFKHRIRLCFTLR